MTPLLAVRHLVSSEERTYIEEMASSMRVCLLEINDDGGHRSWKRVSVKVPSSFTTSASPYQRSRPSAKARTDREHHWPAPHLIIVGVDHASSWRSIIPLFVRLAREKADFVVVEAECRFRRRKRPRSRENLGEASQPRPLFMAGAMTVREVSKRHLPSLLAAGAGSNTAVILKGRIAQETAKVQRQNDEPQFRRSGKY